MIREQSEDKIVGQGIAAYIDYINNIRLNDLIMALDHILVQETDFLAEVANKSANALAEIDLAKTEINNIVTANRGNITGMHGFIAEFAEAGVRNAREAFKGLQNSVILLNNNGPADLILQGNEVQMKFYANILEEVKQAEKYRDMKMMFPKDHFEVIMKIMSGAKDVEFNGSLLSGAKIDRIKKLVENETNLRGIPHEQWLKSSVHDYKEVQRGVIKKTLENEIKGIKKQTSEQKFGIKKEAVRKRQEAYQEAQSSFGEATKVAGLGAAVQGGLNIGLFIYQKHKAGKEIWNFDINDWEECGLTTAAGALKGGVSGYAIYSLTNVFNLAAPSAGAITSGTFGLSSAVIKYRLGEISTDEFIELVTFNAIDSTGAAIGAAIGQTVIPIPVAGALVGSIVVNTALSLGKDIFNEQEEKAINYYKEKINLYVEALEEKYQLALTELLNKYYQLGELQQYSFDFNLNIQLKFVSSISLAELTGVQVEKVLKNLDEIDKYFKL